MDGSKNPVRRHPKRKRGVGSRMATRHSPRLKEDHMVQSECHDDSQEESQTESQEEGQAENAEESRAENKEEIQAENKEETREEIQSQMNEEEEEKTPKFDLSCKRVKLESTGLDARFMDRAQTASGVTVSGRKSRNNQSGFDLIQLVSEDTNETTSVTGGLEFHTMHINSDQSERIPCNLLRILTCRKEEEEEKLIPESEIKFQSNGDKNEAQENTYLPGDPVAVEDVPSNSENSNITKNEDVSGHQALEEKNKLENQIQVMEELLKVLVQERDQAINEQKEMIEALQLERVNSSVVKEAADKALLASDQEIISLRNQCQNVSKMLTDAEVKHSTLLTANENIWKQKLENMSKESDSLRGHLGKLEYGRLLIQRALHLNFSSSGEKDFSREVEAIEALNETLCQEKTQRENKLGTERQKISQLEQTFQNLKDNNFHLKKMIQEKNIEEQKKFMEKERLLREDLEAVNKEVNDMKTKLDQIKEGKSMLQTALGIKVTTHNSTDFGPEMVCVGSLLEQLRAKEQAADRIRLTQVTKETFHKATQVKMLEDELCNPTKGREQSSKNIESLPMEDGDQTVQRTQHGCPATKETCDIGLQVSLRVDLLCHHTEELTHLQRALDCQVNLSNNLRDKLAVKQREIKALILCLKREYNDTILDYEKLLASLMWVADASRERMKTLEDTIRGQFE